MVALLEERDPQIMEDLTASGVDVRDVHAEVRRSLGTGEERLWEGILVTPRVRKIIALAEHDAGECPVDPSHLFRALRAEGGSLAAEVLRRTAASRNTAGLPE